MNKKATLLLVVMIAFGVVQASQAEDRTYESQYHGIVVNLIANSNFASGLPVNWARSAYIYSDSLFSWDPNTKSVAVRVPAGSPNDAGWVQTVSVETNTNYVLSGYIKTKNVEYSSQSVQAGANLSILEDLPSTGFFTFSDPLFGDNGWTLRELRFNTGPNSRITIALRVGMYSGTTTGSAWFRNISLYKGR